MISFENSLNLMNDKNSKSVIRTRMRTLRDDLELHVYRKCSNSIMERCTGLEEWRKAQIVHIYVSAINNEVDTLGLIYNMFEKGKYVVVPKCLYKLHGLQSIHITSLDELLPCKYGLMEPGYNPENEIMPDGIDMVITPILAFDREGGRLGFGRGCYDSLIGECTCPKIGLAYSFQEIDRVPMEIHDQKLDIIITEKEVIRVDHE